MTQPQFVIAAPTSNAGKTTLTLGLLRVLQNRGLQPQSYKCGPDYIDPKFHQVATQRPGINLDLYFMSPQHLRHTYATYQQSARSTCIEGVMGLFDGARKAEGSTAAIAKALQLPVILVVDAKAVAYSVAPLLYGFQHFDPDVHIAGVIFNRVNTASHYQFLTEACQDVGITSLGYLPHLPDCEIPSRHLGLSIDRMQQYASLIQRVAQQLEKTVDINQLLAITQRPVSLPEPLPTAAPNQLTIGIATDEAFNFTYPQNLHTLQRMGTVIPFSPLTDPQLPAADLLYFPGGYPELHLTDLAANTSMLTSIRQFGESGGAILAECGGLMYLGQQITTQQGDTHLMVGLLPHSTTLQSMQLTLGYRTVSLHGHTLKGHEFHYSSLQNHQAMPHLGTVTSARGNTLDTKIYQYKNTLASYIHFYFGTDASLTALIRQVLPDHSFTNPTPS